MAGKKSGALELLEESLQILRGGGAAILLLHWTGALPFAIALLWLLRDTGFSWGGSLLLRDSLLCALAFIWMSYWKSLASRRTFLLLAPGADVVASTPNRIALQSIFQTLKLFVMPLAIASLLAWSGASVFFRTLALEPISSVRPIRSGLQRAFTAATSSYAENAVAFLTAAAFAIVTCLNVLVALALLPSLWKALTGYETDWSRLETPGVLFSLLAVAAIATWLLIDPWLQTYSTLRVFYRNAHSDGRDLLRDIARLAAVGLICFLLMPAYGSSTPENNPQQGNNARQALSRGIDRASQDINYGWLRPAASRAPRGFLGEVAKKINEGVVSTRDHIRNWSRSFLYWLRDLFGKQGTVADDRKKSKPHSEELRWTLALLAVFICGAIVALFLRSGKVRAVQAESASGALPSADVFNERLLASDVSQEEWLRLAFEYLSKSQTRLAARAFYLANLSYLGAQSRLSLSLWKSNRLYERELARQPNVAVLSAAFVAGNRLYERAWYGMRELGGEQMEVLKGAVDQLRHGA